MTATPHMLTRRHALVRVVVSVALGAALAAAFIAHGITASHATVTPGTTGTAASQIGAFQSTPTDSAPPSAVAAGLSGASADSGDVHLLGTNVDGQGADLYAAVRSNGGACDALATAKGTVATTCFDSIPAAGATVGASDADGWTVYGFAANDVVGVDVVVDGKALPATMLPNAYAADLGGASVSDATALVVRHADGTSDTVATALGAAPPTGTQTPISTTAQAPGS